MTQDFLVIKAIKKVLPAVVSITVSKYLEFFQSPAGAFGFERFFTPPQRKKVKTGGGSGFIVDKSGIILTNRHVMEDSKAHYMVVLQDGRKFEPEILAVDPIKDIAVLKITGFEKENSLTMVELGDSSKIELGQSVIAIGNALGLFKNTVSSGIVSGLSREITAQSEVSQERTKLRGLIQTDAAINPGNSGGPLIDLEGKAIGINAATVFGAENISFALPINNAKKAFEELKKFGRIRQPFLGLRYILLDKEIQERFGLPIDFGALVISEPDVLEGSLTAVVPGSPAYKAGIKETDIILEIENKKITFQNTISDVLQDFEIGNPLSFKVLRNGAEKIFKLVLGEK